MSDLLITVSGDVQGVGFRWWTLHQAAQLDLRGYAKNLPNGDVEIRACGADDATSALLRLLREQPSTARRPGHVTAVASTEVTGSEPQPGFTVR